jgi:hypothetical protein
VPVSVAIVKLTSYTGEFAEVADGTVELAVEEAALHYRSLPTRRDAPVRQAVVDRLIALHAAHLLHQGIKYESEAGEENGGGGGQAGPVSSAHLDRVGSWTFKGNTSSEGKASKSQVPIEDWADSPYGRRWFALWKGIPPATASTGRAVP